MLTEQQNFIETFNNVISELRDNPILVLLEGIRKKISTWPYQRKTEAVEIDVRYCCVLYEASIESNF